jgi:hypothetical protein
MLLEKQPYLYPFEIEQGFPMAPSGLNSEMEAVNIKSVLLCQKFFLDLTCLSPLSSLRKD